MHMFMQMLRPLNPAPPAPLVDQQSEKIHVAWRAVMRSPSQ